MKIEKLLNMYNRVVRNRLNQVLAAYDLTENNYYYVLLVCENEGITQNELMRLVYRKQSIVTKALQRLIADGWVAFASDATDQRRKPIFPTAKSMAIYQELKATTTAVNQWAVTGLDVQEQQQLERLLTKAVHEKLPDEII